MTLKREIKDAYIEGGNSIYVKTHSNAIYVDDNETETLTQKLDNVKDSIAEHTTQLDTIEKKLLNPEMFRLQNTLEVDDQTALNSAIDFATTNNLELHLYKEYIIDKLVLNKDLTIISHNAKLTNKSEQDIFIEVSESSKIKIKGVLNVKANLCKIGILNNNSELNLEHLIITKAKEKNVEYKKTLTGGYGEIDYLESSLSPIGLHLNTTDTKVKRYQGFCCLTHIKNSGGGNFIENAHGWGLNDTTYGDWVTGSTMLDITGGSCAITNLYADTTENAIKLPNDNQHTLISITNLTYFLNRTYYPDGINRPYLFKNIENFTGQLSCKNIQADNSAWRDSTGQQVELIPTKIDVTRINIDGLCNNGYLDNVNFIKPQIGDLYNYITDETSDYFSPYARGYYIDKKNIDIKIHCSMTKSIPNGAIAYQCTFSKEPFTKININALYKGIINDNGKFIDLHVQIVDNVLTVTNKTGDTISSGSLVIRVHHVDF